MSIVLLGQIGSGKTTLYNKITLSQEKTTPGGNSVTMSVFMKRSCFGQGFQVLDTPGFGSDSNKLDHVAGVISALSEGPLNRIVVVVKFDRTPTIIENVQLDQKLYENNLQIGQKIHIMSQMNLKPNFLMKNLFGLKTGRLESYLIIQFSYTFIKNAAIFF